jgi:hypothetical protein
LSAAHLSAACINAGAAVAMIKLNEEEEEQDCSGAKQQVKQGT